MRPATCAASANVRVLLRAPRWIPQPDMGGPAPRGGAALSGAPSADSERTSRKVNSQRLAEENGLVLSKDSSCPEARESASNARESCCMQEAVERDTLLCMQIMRLFKTFTNMVKYYRDL